MNSTTTGNGLVAGRIPELDGIRGLAILLVLVWHYVQGGIPAESGAVALGIKQLLGFTWSGVDLFFVLSGFLIAGILIDNRGQKNYFSTFYLRRACRIMPVYYLVLLTFTALVALSLYQYFPLSRLLQVSAVPEWSYWVFLQNVFMARAGTFGPEWLSVSWSLAVEEQFYLLLPLLVFVVPPRRLIYVLTGFVVLAILLRLLLPGASAYINTAWRADSLMIGAMLAWAVRNPRFAGYTGGAQGRRAMYLLFAFLLLGALLTNVSQQRPFSLVFTYTWLACLYAVLILLVLIHRQGILAGLLRNPLLIRLGGISYAVYLIHQIASLFLHGLIRHASPLVTNWRGAAVTLLALLVTLLLAQLSFVLIERRAIRFGHRFRYT